MAPVCSTLRCDQQQRENLAKWQAQQNLHPAIQFYPKFKKPEKDKDGNDRKSESVRKFEVPLDISDVDSKTYDCCVNTFERGTPEECCDMRDKVEGLATELGCAKQNNGESDADFKDRKAEHLARLCTAVFDGFSLTIFEEQLNSAALSAAGPYKKF